MENYNMNVTQLNFLALYSELDLSIYNSYYMFA